LAKADSLLAEAEREESAALDRLALNAAETVARRGKIALTRLRYGEAAQRFAEAAALLPPNNAKRVRFVIQPLSAKAAQTARRINFICPTLSVARLHGGNGSPAAVPVEGAVIGYAAAGGFSQRNGSETRLRPARWSSSSTATDLRSG
jgi:hypothetical protein